MLYPFAVVLADSAVRSEKEALHLTWRSVNLEKRVLVIRGKGGRARVVPMSRRVHRVLTEHAAKYRNAVYNGKRTEWVFHHTTTRRHHKAGARIKTMRGAFKNAAKRAGIEEELRQHDMRHSAATNWLAAGASQKKVQDILGHTNPKMTDRYTHLIAEHLRDVVDLNLSPNTESDEQDA
jgi:integrase/recombinase XerD